MAANKQAGFVVALIVSALILGACTNIETPDFAADAAQIMAAAADASPDKKWTPIPLRVGVAPMRSAPENTAGEFNKEDTRRWVLATGQSADEKYMNEPLDGLNPRLINVLSEYKMFESVALIEGVTSQTTREELLRLALAQHFDVVLEPTISQYDVEYLDSNGAYGWNMFVWWMVSPVISWWIADEDFGINLHLNLRMFPVTQNSLLAGTTLKPVEPIVRSLDDWDQGWHIFSIFSTPGYLGEDNWKRIGDRMRPIAENELKKALLRYITSTSDGGLKRQSLTRSFRDSVRKRVALIVGADGPLVPRFAERDVAALDAHLQEAVNLSVPAGALRRLIGPRATSTNVVSDARELARLARHNDDVFLIFSGAGTVDESGRPVLVLSSSGGQGAQTVVLEDLLDNLVTGKPRSVTLMLDCSFTAPGDRRCVLTDKQLDELVKTHKDRNLYEPIQKKLESSGIKCVILAATDAVPANPHGMKALEIDELQKGLFTSFALDAMQGKADTDGNGLVSFVEFESFVKGKVSHVARLERENQTGYFYITEDFKADFALPTGKRQP